MKKILTTHSKIPPEAVVGIRSPYLQGGGDVMFEMMEENGFTYDCTYTNRDHGYMKMNSSLW